MAGAAPGLSLHPPARPARRPGRASPSPGATATSPATRAISSGDSPPASASCSPADYLSSPTASGTSSSYSNTQVWAQGGYVPSARFGVQYQLIRSRPSRRAFVVSDADRRTTRIGPGFKGTRTDAQMRLSLRSRGDGSGPGLDLIYGRSAWDGTGIDQQINQIGGNLSYRAPTFSAGRVGVSPDAVDGARHAGTVGWTPRAILHRQRRGGAAAPLRRPQQRLRLAAGRAPAGARPRAHRERRALGKTGRRAVDAHRHGAEASRLPGGRSRSSGPGSASRSGWSRTSAFSPVRVCRVPAGPVARAVAEWIGSRWARGWRPSAGSRWRAGTAIRGRDAPTACRRPTRWPPPPCARSFCGSFRSGIFDLKLRLSMESVGRGTIGRDDTGEPRSISAARRSSAAWCEIQLQSFSLYWDRGNLTATKLTYVPGFRIPAYGSNFGVRWEFLN